MAELDLGPIRVLGARTVKDAGTVRYILSLSIDSSLVEVSSSALGRSIGVSVNGQKLAMPEDEPAE